LAVLQKANLRVHDFVDVYVDALLTGGLALSVVVALSWLTFTLIERPFMRMRRNYYAH
jgi:peptidoglycan/LPS O-acetylase OafA/YrhL